MVVMSPRFGASGQCGEDAGDGFVEFGEPHGLGVEDVLDGEVEPAVADEQRPDPEFWVAAALTSCMKSAPVTVVPGIASLRS